MLDILKNSFRWENVDFSQISVVWKNTTYSCDKHFLLQNDIRFVHNPLSDGKTYHLYSDISEIGKISSQSSKTAWKFTVGLFGV